MKTCSDCRKEFPANLEFFYKKRDFLSSYCKDCHKARGKAWKKANEEKRRAKNKEWIAKNPEKVKGYRAKWHNSNPEKSKEYWANRSLESLKRKKETNKAWAISNNDKINGHRRKRRALKIGNGHTPYTVQEVLDKYGTDCHLCQTPINLSVSRQVGKPNWEKSLHIDHFVPISKGGPDTLENVRPSHGICNIVKSDRV